MSDAIQPQAAPSMREDIAFLRAMAVEGARGPVYGGSILLAAGLIYASANIATWYVDTHMPPSEAGYWMEAIWGGAIAAQAAIMIIIRLSLRRSGRGVAVANRSNRMFALAWHATGIGIFSCLASFVLIARAVHLPEVFWAFPAVILAFYGVGWTVTAAGSNERWAWGVAALSFLFAIVSGAFAGSANLFLLMAAALLLLLAAPGAILIKRASVRS